MKGRVARSSSVTIPLSECTTVVTTDAGYQCPLCPERLSHFRLFISHVQVDHPFHKMCPVCYKLFTKQVDLETHKLEKHSGAPPKREVVPAGSSLLRCAKCRKTFQSPDLLTKHVEAVHDNVNKPSCSGNSIPSLSTNFSPKKRKNSPVSANDDGSVMTRIVRDNKSQHNCTYCHETFSSQCDLSRHLLQHTGEKPYQCLLCKASFTRKSSLNNHERIHSGIRPYICSVCSETFCYRYQFNRHKSEHE